MISFVVDRDEPFADNHKLFINWGVFENDQDNDPSKVLGQHDPHLYDIETYYSEFFDRVLIRLLWE